MSHLGGATARFGYQSWIGVGQEATYGTLTAGETVASYMEFYSESMKQNRESIFQESINMTRDITRHMQGNETIDGSLEFDLNTDEDAQMIIIKQVMGGTCTSVSSSATEVAHTFNLGDMESNDGSVSASNYKSLTLSVQKGGATAATYHFWGCRVNAITFTGEIGSPVKCSCDIIGKQMTTTAEAHTVTFTTARPLHFTGVSISTGDSIGNLSATSCIGFEVSMNNNLVSDANARELGSRLLKMCPPTNREVTGKLTMRFDTTTAQEFFIAQTATAIKILMSSEDTCGSTAGNSSYSMFINLPTCYLEESPMPEISEKGIITQELNFRCIKGIDSAGAVPIAIQANNDTAGY